MTFKRQQMPETIKQLRGDISSLEAQIKKAESLTSQAVAREAARWEEGVRRIVAVEHMNCDGIECGSASTCMDVKNIARELSGDTTDDWLAKHDAEVLRPWREALEAWADDFKRDIASDNFVSEDRHEAMRATAALLSQTPGRTCMWDTMEQAIAAWNRRAPSERERLLEEIAESGRKLSTWAACVRDVNTPEWIDGLVERVVAFQVLAFAEPKTKETGR